MREASLGGLWTVVIRSSQVSAGTRGRNLSHLLLQRRLLLFGELQLTHLVLLKLLTSLTLLLLCHLFHQATLLFAVDTHGTGGFGVRIREVLTSPFDG